MPRSYTAPPASDRPARELVAQGDGGRMVYVFHDRLEIRRHRTADLGLAGVLFVDDPLVSSRHCVLEQAADGRVTVRDTSLNGTWIDGRRMPKDVEVELLPGQVLHFGAAERLALGGDGVRAPSSADARSVTLPLVRPTAVTVLVGDLRDYTGLVQTAPPEALQASVERVFQRLSRQIEDLGGTVKEFQGDAVFAFFEERPDRDHAVDACAAARALDVLVRRLADDPTVWAVPGAPLRFDWALATGHVFLRPSRDGGRAGLSVVGRPVVLAFRLEKVADDATGPIVASRATRDAAAHVFAFDDAGEVEVKGFQAPERVFALRGLRG